MRYTNITNIRKNISMILRQTIQFNEPVHVVTTFGNAVILSEADYNGLLESLHVSSIPGLKEKIVDGLRTPVGECLTEDEVNW